MFNRFKSYSNRQGGPQTANSERIQMLATPKDQHQLRNIFFHSEFRGLLHADYMDALKNTDHHFQQKSAFLQDNMTNGVALQRGQS